MLIVEDQDFMRRVLVDYLQSAYPDAAIMEAADGARALELCGSHSLRLVLRNDDDRGVRKHFIDLRSEVDAVGFIADREPRQ